jgi:Zn-dependent metalloprotease
MAFGLTGCGAADPGLVAPQPLVGVDSARPAAEVLPLWQRFATEQPAARVASWNPGSGTPRSIYGELSSASAGSAATAARRFLADHANLFRFDPALADLVPGEQLTSQLGEHVTFQQNHRGIPVRGAEVRLHFGSGGRLIALTNTYVPHLGAVDVVPWVPAADAIALARTSVPADPGLSDLANVAAPTARLVIDAQQGASRPALAWEVTLPSTGPTWEVLINAHDGRLLGRPADLNRYFVNGTGSVFIDNAVVATRNNSLRDNNNAASAVPSSAYSTVTLQGLAGTGYLDGQYASSSASNKKGRAFNTANNFAYDRSSDAFSEVMGYYYIDFAERYIQSLGFSNINNRQVVFSVNVYRSDNSYYSPSNKQITYGLGGVDDAEDSEVILHELGHAIQDSQVPGFGSSAEGGAMGEGFGDYWAGSVNAQFFSGGFQDACVAEWDSTSYSSTNPPCLRRLDGTKHYPENVAGEVHADGEIWSAALWQIRGALGGARADRLILQAHFLLSSSANFRDGSNALVTAAINLGYTSTEVSTVRTILQNRGFTVTA